MQTIYFLRSAFVLDVFLGQLLAIQVVHSHVSLYTAHASRDPHPGNYIFYRKKQTLQVLSKRVIFEYHYDWNNNSLIPTKQCNHHPKALICHETNL